MGTRRPRLLLLLLAAVAGWVHVTYAQSPWNCMSTWTRHNDFCYLYDGTARNWLDAENWCRKYNAHLVAMHSDAENNWMPNLNGSPYCWIGLNDRNIEGTYQNSDNTPYDYSKWNAGEPNNSGDEDCIHITGCGGNVCVWNDLACGSTRCAICSQTPGTLLKFFSCGLNAWLSTDTGWQSVVNGGAKYWINGVLYNPPTGRGFSVYVFDYNSAYGGHVLYGVYDTYADGGASARMTAFMDNVNIGQLVVISCWDECVSSLSQNARNYIINYCGSQINSMAYRDSYICVYTKGVITHMELRAQSTCLTGELLIPGVAICATGKYASGANCVDCPAGTYNDVTGATRSAACKSCLAGRYGSATGLTTSSCSGACTSGYYCPAGSSSPTQATCPAGVYSAAGAVDASCTGICPAGKYCVAGTKDTDLASRLCNAGKYSTGGATAATCLGDCDAGYICAAGSTNSKAAECGGIDRFCPAGSSAATTATAGYYTTGGTATTRTGQAICPIGYYCTGGVQSPCPAGRYNDQTGQTACTKVCSAGYFCDAGSTADKVAACGAATCSSKPASCYCPAGTATRVVVTSGYYTTATDMTDLTHRTAQSVCEPGYSCTDGIRTSSATWNDCVIVGSAAIPSTTRAIAESVTGTIGTAVTANMGLTPTYTVAAPVADVGCTWTTAPSITVATTGQLSVSANPPNYENCASFSVLLTATTAVATLQCTVQVAVTDVNEAPAFTNCGTARSVSEQSAKSTAVGVPVVATDPDLGQTSYFYITGGSGQSKFSISPCSGQIMVADPKILYSSATSYTLNLRVDDDGSPVLSATCSLTITILDVNDPPDVLDATFSIAENSAFGTVIGTFTATDPDYDPLVWSISITNPANVFAVVNGQLRVNGNLDFESAAYFAFQVTVSDGRGGVDTANVVVTVTDVNDAPVIASTTFGVAENSAIGTSIGTIAVMDQDVGDTATLSITAGNTGNAFSFNGKTLQVAAAVLNYEVLNSYTLTVKATDKGGLSSTATITVLVSDVNEAPVFTAVSRSVAEDATIGTAVGSGLGATDPDAGQTAFLVYTINTGNTGGAFSVDSSGILRVAAALDFETLSSYSLGMSVRDGGGLTASATVTVAVTNVNEPPVMAAGITRSIVENAAVGTTVGAALPATDPEGDTFTFSFVAGNDGNTFGFTSASSGQLNVANKFMLDFETRKTFTLTIRIMDSQGASSTQMVTINILNVNEPPVWDYAPGSTVSLAVTERSVAGTTVGTRVTASDPDGDVVTFAIQSQPAGNYYSVNSATGQISVKAVLPSVNGVAITHNLVLRASDPSSAFADQSVAVLVVDENDPPVYVDAVRTVQENSPLNTLVGLPVTATDPDATDVLVYSISSGVMQSEFVIDINTAQLSVGNPILDFETTPKYTLRVTAKDTRPIGALSADATITINVQDMPEPPTIADASRSVNENSPVGTNVGSPVTGKDPDAGQTALLKYSLTSGRTDLFAITDTTGQVTVKTAALDYEKTQMYILGIQATDPTARSATASLTINILNVNDPPTFSAYAAVSVREDAAVGNSVATFTATDQDGDVLTYALLGGNTNSAFSLAASTAQLTVAKALDFETTASYSLTVQATDTSGATATTTVVVNLIDVNEPPVANTWATAVLAESVPVGTIVAAVSFKDPDAGTVLTYRLSDGNVDSTFAINTATGVVTTAKTLNFEALQAYSLEVTAVDQGGLTGAGRLAVSVTDVNEPPTLAPSTQSVPENSPTGTTIGVALVAQDPDAGETLTYTITGGNTGGLFTITGSLLKVGTAVLNYEVQKSYSIQVKVTDKGGLTSTATITVAVVDVNEAPVIADAVRRLNENSAVNFRIGDPLPATDEDEGQILNYAIVSGNDLKHFKINLCDGQLQVNTAAINFEAISSYTLVVSVTDDGVDPGPPRLTDTAVVTVFVDNVNEPPVVIDLAVSVLENKPVGFAFGTMTVNEPDFKDVPAQTQTYAIVAGNEDGFFAINSATGAVSIARTGLDFETRTAYPLVISATDSGTPRLTSTGNCVITILDANENPIVAAQDRSIAENTAVGVIVGAALVATDPDAGVNGVLTYSIPTTVPFTIDAATGQLRIKTSPDFETQSQYTFTLTVTDGGGLASTATITVTILDVNEAPVLAAATLTIDENSVRGTVIGTLKATDVDAGQVLTYSIVSQTPATAFAIGPLSGVVTVADAVLNFEAQATYTVTVQVTDSGTPTLFTTAIITIKVNNLWEAPVITPGQSRTTPESVALGTQLGGIITATDEDAGDSWTFTISSGNPGNVFSISSTGQLSVTGSRLNFEAVARYNLYLVATDTHGKASTPTLVVVDVTDVNEAPTFSTSNFAVSVPEDAAVNVRVGVLTASDQDANNVLTWSLVSDSSNGAFKVLASTGELLIATPNIISAKIKYTLAVRVQDQGGLTNDATVTVTVTDINHAPIVSNAARSVPENSLAGTAVGAALTATDPENDQLTWRIESGNDNGAFSINPSTGQLAVLTTSALDFETRAWQIIRVEVRDNGPGTLASYATVNVTITNVNEAPSVATGTLSVKENTPVGTTVGKAIATDPDRGDVLAYAITAGNTGNVFTIANTGMITVAIASLNAEAIASYTLTVTVTDKLGLKGSGAITVTIEDVNDAPVLKDTARSVPENSPLGTLVGVQLPATDEDLTRGIQKLTFTITSGNTGNVFAVSNTGQITVAGALNFEALSQYTLRISVTDDGSPSLGTAATVVVTVTDVNEIPVFGAATYTATIAENSAVGARVTMVGAAVSATDPEIAYQTLAFSIAGESVFAINPTTGVVTVRTAALDFETRSTYDLVLQVTDSDPSPLTGTASLRITIVDVNEAPVWNAVPALTVKENSLVGVRVNGAVSASDVDAGVNGQLQYAITGGDGAAVFSIDKDSAVLSVKAAVLNFEVKPTYSLDLSVVDGGGLLVPLSVQIKLLDVNEPPVLLPGERSVPENSLESTPAGFAITGSDVDAGQSSTLAYSITGGDGVGIFIINACSGQVIVRQGVLDFETKSSYTLQITVTDDDTLDPPHLTATAMYTIKLIDVNEAPKIANAARAVDENSPVGTHVGAVLVATDEDRPAQPLTFSFDTGNDAGLFAVANNGQVTVAAAALNFEQQSQYTLVVRVADDKGLYATAALTISINNINEAPVLAPVTCSVPENSAVNLLVCELAATDEDTGQVLSYALQAAGNTGGAFSLTSGNNRGRLLVAGSLDFEAIPSFRLTVSVTDDGMIGGAQLAPITVNVATTVNIVNVNEAPSIAAQQRSIKENSPVATPIGAPLVASDPDAGTVLSFSIVSGNVDNLFSIVALTGQLIVASPANYEARSAYDLVIQVADSGFSSQLTASAYVTVTIENVNEAPVLTGSQLWIKENVVYGTKPQPLPGFQPVAAADVDAEDQTGLVFSIVSGNDLGYFRVDAATGELFTVPKVSMDYETQATYNMILQVTDHGGLFSTAPVSVAVQDINEAPWLELPAVNVSMKAQLPANSLITKYVGRDQDAGDVLQFFLQGPNADLFTINAARGELYIALPDDTRVIYDPNSANQVALQVGVRDRAGLTGVRTVYLNIIDNNNPPSLSAASFDIAENSAFGTKIGTLVGTDKDAVQTLTYTVVSVDPEAAAPLFTLTTAANPAGGKQVGVLTVADTSRLANPPKLDYETFKSVSLVVQVTDNGPGTLSASATIVVRLTDVNEPPTIALAAADAAGVLYVDENVAVGTQVGGRLVSSDPDAQDSTLTLVLAWNEAANGATLPFSVDASGQVYVSSAVLNFEAKPRYNVRATAVDHSGVTAKVDFAVAINNVNEAPVMRAFTMAIDENSAVGAVLGALSATDADAGTVFKFQFAPGTESNAASSMFAVDPSSGSVTVASPNLDFERTQTYVITVRVRDNGLGVESLSLYADAQLTINIRDLNDVAITGFNTDGSTVASAVAHPTDVPQRVTILGRDFGPVAPTSAVTVTATYASASRPGQIYTATGCQVTTANTIIQCFTVPGAGTQLTWTIVVNGASATATMTTSYAAPVIASVSGAAALPTAGGSSVVLAGSNFGPLGTAVEAVVYGPSDDGPGLFRYRATDCAITTAHTRITCKSAPGVGRALQWRATVERLASAGLITTTSYATPNITAIAGGASLGTQGGETVVLSGTDFGRAVDGTVVATYGAQGTGLTAVGCVVVTDHTVIRCQTAPGVGALHSWIVRIGDVASKPSGTKTSYKPPVISEVSGPGYQEASTRGMEDLYITGTSFGPLSTVPAVQYGGPKANLYTAQSCIVSQAHSRIICKTAEGTGRGHSVRVQIGGQWSHIAEVEQSYAAPLIIDYSGEGAFDALTKGGQAVLIEGRNFGSVAHDKIDLVMYGRNASKLEFTARDCHVATSHSFIRCNTAPGAGAGLKWSVIIDGQKSGVPTTNYAKPTVSAIVGPGAMNALTDGGQQFTILGNNFGPAGNPSFLELVTYGVTGAEYTADRCAVVNHTAISCYTVPGVGSNLHVRVRVYGQSSTPSGVMSYAAPAISTASVLSGSTTGGTVVSITGTNFGMATFLSGSRSSLVRVTFGGLLLADGVDVYRYASDNGVHSLAFTVPEAVTFGRDRAVQVQVVDLHGNGQVSNTVTFKYDDPVITGVFRLRNNVLRIEGANFGIDGTVTATTKAGVTTVIPKSSATTYVHTLIEVSLDAVAGTVVVARGEQESNIGYFATVVPTISALKSDGAGGALFFSTEGGESLTVSGYDMGEQDKLSDVNITVSTQNARGVIVAKPCVITKFVNLPGDLIPGTTQKADDQQIITCRLPPGQGENQRVSVIVRGNASPASRINYEQPWIQTIATNFDDGTLTPTSGKHPNGQAVRVKLTGRNFGLANQTVFLYRCADQSDIQNCEYMMIASNCQFTQRTAECDMPEGEGRGLFASIIISTGGDPSLIYDNPQGQFRHPTVPTGAYGFRDGHRVTIDCAEPHIVVSGRRLAAGNTVLSQTGPTTGGFLLTLNGENFGRSSETISVTVGTYTCAVVSHTHSSVTCKMPAGQGANLPVTVTVKGVSNSNKPLFSYLPPAISGLSITHGPTSGLPVGSVKRQNVTITGTNFGKSGTVLFGANPADQYQDDIAVPAADVFLWTHNNIVLAMPPGQGKGRVVTVTVGSQISGSTTFDYDDPIIDHIIPDTDIAKHEFLPTDGLYNVTVIGRNFGTHFGAVVLTHTRLDAGFRCGGDGKSYQSTCAINAGLQSHTSMRFLMPRGVGKNFQVRVQVGKQQSGFILQSYDAPRITRVRPNQADALGQNLLIDGKNFGDSSVGLNISVHSIPCDNPQFIAGSVLPGTGFVQPPFLQCKMRTGTVGWKNITVAIAGQEVTAHWSSALLVAMCQRNYYGDLNELCLPCMLGGYCDGGLTPPVSIKGFWMQNATADQCPAERLPPYVAKENCLQAVACEPQSACTGSNTCSLGYAGERCALCSKSFYRRAGECIKCPDQPLLLVFGFIGAAIVLCCVGYILNKKSVNLAFVSIGVDYFQVLALFSSSKIVWPPTLKQLFVYMSAFNFNLEITAPECSIPDLGYTNKWYMIMSLPVAATAMFVLLHISLVAHKFIILGRRKNLNKHASAFVSTGMVMFYYLYLYLTRTALDIFNCAPTTPPDGYTYLEVVFERCDKPGGIHERLLPLAVGAFIVYSLGFPAALFTLLYKNRLLIMEDQLLRANGTGQDRLTNPHAYDCRKRYHKLYYHFKPDQWFWILAVIMRKGFLAFTALMFNKNPSFQLAMALLVMFLAYTAQVKYRPYMSVSENQEVLRDHQYKAELGNYNHQLLAANLSKVQARSKARTIKFSWESAIGSRKAAVAAAAAARYFWNYNTVEMVLLFCAVLVNLAGVMFSSGQLDSEFYSSYREGITWAVILVIVTSVGYFFFVLGSEVYGTVCQDKIAKKATSKDSKKADMARKNVDLFADANADKLDMAGFVNPYFKAMPGMAPTEVQAVEGARLQMNKLKNDNTELVATLTQLKTELQTLQAQSGNSGGGANGAQAPAFASTSRGRGKRQFAQVRMMSTSKRSLKPAEGHSAPPS